MKFEHSDVLKQLPEQFFASLVKKVNEKIAAGHDVINLGQGNPDQPTPEHIVDTMAQASATLKTTGILPFAAAVHSRRRRPRSIKGNTA